LQVSQGVRVRKGAERVCEADESFALDADRAQLDARFEHG
jgi:hypothetical protein